MEKAATVLSVIDRELKSVPYSERYTLPKIPGIYLVYDHQLLLYVGASVNLRRRFVKHHRASQFPDTARITWFDYDSEGLNEMEQSLIDSLNPTLNKTPVIAEKLATFRVDEDTWQNFKALCKEQNSNASAVLLSYIQKCLDEGKIPELSQSLPQSNLEIVTDQKLEAKLAPICNRLSKLEKILLDLRLALSAT